MVLGAFGDRLGGCRRNVAGAGAFEGGWLVMAVGIATEREMVIKAIAKCWMAMSKFQVRLFVFVEVG